MSVENLFLLFSLLLVIVLAGVIYYYQKRIKRISDLLQGKDGGQTKRGASTMEDLEGMIRKWLSSRNEEYETLQKLESYRKDYLGNVSHELKTPIFNIQGYLATLLDHEEQDPEIRKRFLDKCMKNTDRLVAIVDDLQTITQLEKGELEIDPETFDVVALVKDVMDGQELRAAEKKIKFELQNKTTSNELIVWADRFRIRQVLVNLVVNSLRYGKPDGRTTVKISDTGDKYTIEVSDTGIGIAAPHLNRIFERFYRVDKSRSRELGGTGLGLSIVKHILEAHGQNITAMSTEGVGSVFTFTLQKAEVI